MSMIHDFSLTSITVFPLTPPPTDTIDVLQTPNYDTLITVFKGPTDFITKVEPRLCLNCSYFGLSRSFWIRKNRIVYVCKQCTDVYVRRPDVYPALFAPNDNSYRAKYQFALHLYQFYKVYENGPTPEYEVALDEAIACSKMIPRS
jgi:hypothetical protein